MVCRYAVRKSPNAYEALLDGDQSVTHEYGSEFNLDLGRRGKWERGERIDRESGLIEGNWISSRAGVGGSDKDKIHLPEPGKARAGRGMTYLFVKPRGGIHRSTWTIYRNVGSKHL